jgi:hypothetical protein
MAALSRIIAFGLRSRLRAAFSFQGWSARVCAHGDLVVVAVHRRGEVQVSGLSIAVADDDVAAGGSSALV